MIDSYLMGDLQAAVRKKCKTLYKKGWLDTSWKPYYIKIMDSGIREIYKFLNSNK